MENVADTLNRLRGLSREIIEEALPIMRELTLPSNEVQDILLELNHKLTPEEATTMLQDAAMEMIEDVRSVNEGIEAFAAEVAKSAIDDSLRDFLHQVWFGDVYDVEGAEALLKLEEDLRSQLSNMTVNVLLDKALMRCRGAVTE